MIARANPFCASRVLKIRYELQQISWQELEMRLERLQYRAAIVGPEGSGKTTLLEDLTSRLSKQFDIQWFSLSEDARCPSFANVESHHLLMVDGADELGFWGLRRLMRRKTGGLIVTLHRPGPLPTLLQTSTSAELLMKINEQLVGEDLRDLSQHLFLKHQGNLRDALRELYDVFSRDRRR